MVMDASLRLVKNSTGWWWITCLTEEQEAQRLSREKDLALIKAVKEAAAREILDQFSCEVVN